MLLFAKSASFLGSNLFGEQIPESFIGVMQRSLRIKYLRCETIKLRIVHTGTSSSAITRPQH